MKTIIGIHDLSREEREKLENELFADPMYPKPWDEFDGFGLRYPLNHIVNLGMAVILRPIEYMAEYVDVVTKTLIDMNDSFFIEDQVMNLDIREVDIKDPGIAGSIGNLAYIALHCKDEKAKGIAWEFLEKCKKKYTKKTPN